MTVGSSALAWSTSGEGISKKIVGDSVTRDLKGWMMSRHYRVTCHSLSGCNNEEMVNLCRAVCGLKPDYLIIHVGTNSLFPYQDKSNAEQQPPTAEQVANGIKLLYQTVTNEFPGVKVFLSLLVVRGDYGEEGLHSINQVNRLVQSCNLPHISHDNITEEHLNSGKQHLNTAGSKILAKNYIDFMRNLGA